MKVGEIWMFKEDKYLARITRIWQDDPDDRDKMVSVEPVPYDEKEAFADYYLDEFILYFEKVRDYPF